MTSKSFKDINIVQYSDHSFVLTGDTRKYKEDIKKMGGKYNSRLQNGPGWIFSNKSKDTVISFIKNGSRLVSKDEELEGERRTKEWEVKRKNGESFESSSPIASSSSSSSGSDYKKLYKMMVEMKKEIKQLKQKVNNLELIINEGGEVEVEVEVEGDSDSESEEEEKVPHKRLLR